MQDQFSYNGAKQNEKGRSVAASNGGRGQVIVAPLSKKREGCLPSIHEPGLPENCGWLTSFADGNASL